MKTAWLRMGLGVLLSVVGACTPDAILQRMENSPEVTYGREVIELAIQGKKEELSERFVDAVKSSEDFDSKLEQVLALLPKEELLESKLIGFNKVIRSEGTQTNLSFQGKFNRQYLLVQPMVGTAGEGLALLGFHIQPLAGDLREINALRLSGLTWKHYSMAGTAFAFLGLSILALALCIRTPMARRKWLWIVFIVAGLGKFTINWTTGETALAPISIQALGTGMFRGSSYAPWLLSVSFPLGAFVFLALRSRLAASKPPAQKGPRVGPPTSRPASP